MSAKIRYTDEPLGKLKIVRDFHALDSGARENGAAVSAVVRRTLIT